MAAGLAVGQPSIGAEVGGWIDGEASELPPAPLVEINVGGMKYSTVALEPTLSPSWNQVLLVNLNGARPSDPVVLNVRDGLDGQVVGTTSMTVADLISRASRTIGISPSVPSLNLSIEPTRIEHAAYVLHVPGDGQAAFQVTGGDMISLTATGEVCVVPGKCFDAGGQDELQPTGIWAQPYVYKNWRSNLAEYQVVPHASLIGVLGDGPIFVGRGATFHVPRSGTLRLFVNDSAPENNTGAFEVELRVNP